MATFARRPLWSLLWIGGRGSLDTAQRRPVQNCDAVQVAGSGELSLFELVVGHAYMIQQLELVGASRRQFALVLVDDSVAEGMDRHAPCPALQQPLALGSVVLACPLLDDLIHRLVFA